MNINKPTRFNADLHFIAPLPLGECRRRLKGLNLYPYSKTGSGTHVRFFARTPDGAPFLVVSWGASEDKKPSIYNTKLEGYLKRRDGDSTYITLYGMSKPIIGGWIIFSLLVCGAITNTVLTGRLLGLAIICWFILMLNASKWLNIVHQRWIMHVTKRLLKASEGRHLLEQDGLIGRGKHKNVEDLFPQYQPNYFVVDDSASE